MEELISVQNIIIQMEYVQYVMVSVIIIHPTTIGNGQTDSVRYAEKNAITISSTTESVGIAANPVHTDITRARAPVQYVGNHVPMKTPNSTNTT